MIHLLDKRTQKRGKWDWVSHHYSEPKLPSPRLRQDHSWSMPTRGHKSHLIPRYPASPHPPHPGPWPTRTGLLYWLTTIQQGQMNLSCRESEAGHRTITRNPYCPVQDCGRTTYGRCPPEGTNLTGYPASPYHLQLRTQASTHPTTVLTNNDSTGSDESQLQGKWGWASHHHSESILPSPRLRQDHLRSMPTRGHKSHRIPSITPPPTSGTLTFTHWTTVLTNNDSTGSDESQLQGKWGWASHHHSESILPSPRLRQDHLWSMPTRGHKSHRIPSITLPPATQNSGLHAQDYFGQAWLKTDDAQTDRHGHEWHHQD